MPELGIVLQQLHREIQVQIAKIRQQYNIPSYLIDGMLSQITAELRAESMDLMLKTQEDYYNKLLQEKEPIPAGTGEPEKESEQDASDFTEKI